MAEVPDIYSDQVSLAQTPYGIALTFSISPSNPSLMGQTPPETRAVVRMSLEHAKIMTMVIRRALKQYELEHLGDPIPLPKSLLDTQKLDPSDW